MRPEDVEGMAISSKYRRVFSAASVSVETPIRLAAAIILSSISVKFWMCSTA